MMPIQNHRGWHTEQVDELFASLLGKGFDNSQLDVASGVTKGETEDLSKRVDESLKLGFRVFG